MKLASLDRAVLAAGLRALSCTALIPAALLTQTFAAEAEKEEVLELSPFTVQAEPNRGYAASETLTGTRVATKIADLPYTVNVLTSEFFEDFAMFELADNLVQIGSFTGLDIGGGFNLRGFSSTSQLRDGFFRLGRYGSSNIDRMEIIKGSNAAIYGRTSPGGMINFISKQPKDRPYSKITANFGDYGTQRGVLETTGPLFQSKLGKTSYVLTASNYQRKFDQEYSRNHNQEYYLAVKQQLPDKSSLLLSAEYFLQIRHSPTATAPLVTDQKGTAATTDDTVVGYNTNLLKYSPYGPMSELNRSNLGFNAVYEKQLSSIWSVRLAGNYYKARRWEYNQNTGWGAIAINKSTGAAPTTARGATPNKAYIFEDGGGFQGDVLAHYWLNNRKIESRTLLTFDFNDYYRYDPTYGFAASTNADIKAWSTARTVTLDPVTLEPTAPLAYFTTPFKWGQEVESRLTRRRTTVAGGLLREQLAFLNGRLLTFAGARFDAVRFQERDYITAASSFTKFPGYENYLPGQMVSKRVNQLKPNVGVNYKVTNDLRIFANYSESYFVNQTDNPVIFADPTYKAETASGYDYGFKGGFFEDRLTFTVSGFYATRNNVSVSDTYESPLGSGNYVTENRREGNQLVRGYELDLNWNINDEFSTLLSWGHVYSIYTDYGTAAPLAVGRRVNGVVPENGGISLRWSPRQRLLSGFSANVGWTYCASTPSEAPDAGDVYNTAHTALVSSTGQWALRTPSYGLWNVGARYKLRARGFDHTIAVNVNNLLDKEYLKVSKQFGERRAFYVTYTLGFGSAH